jgi:hypothetical protein
LPAKVERCDQEKQDEEALRRKHLDQDDESRKRLQDELRKQYGAAARSFENAIQSETKQYVESPKERHLAVRQKYLQFTTWYENKLRDGWELLNISSEIEDYGVVEWKSRILEAGFVDVRMRMRNRELGEYENACHVLGYVLDNEFDIARDPIAVSCTDKAITQYQIEHRFSSKWLVAALPAGQSPAPMPNLSPEACSDWRE